MGRVNKDAVGDKAQKLNLKRLDSFGGIDTGKIHMVGYKHFASDGRSKFRFLFYHCAVSRALDNRNVGFQRLADIRLLGGGVVAPQQDFRAVRQSEQIVAVFHTSDSLQGINLLVFGTPSVGS